MYNQIPTGYQLQNELGGIAAGQNWANAQFANDLANEQSLVSTEQSLEKLFQDRQMNPMLLEEMRNKLDPSLVAANKAKTIADSQKAGYEAQALGKTWESDADTKLSENKTKKASDNLKLYRTKLEDIIQRMMTQPDGYATAMLDHPEIAKAIQPYGADGPRVLLEKYKKLRTMEAEHDKDYIKELEQSRSKKEVAGMQIAGNKDLEQMRIDAGKYNKGQTLTLVQNLAKNGNYQKAAATLEMMAFQETDPAQAIKYREEAAKFEALAKNQAAASKYDPNKLNLPGMTGQQAAQQTPSVITPQTKEDPLGIRK